MSMALGPTSARCWCGHADTETFAPRYRRCVSCGTLVVSPFPLPRHFEVADDERDFYGRRYFTEFVEHAYGHPNLARRAREDLTERCLFWLERVISRLAPGGPFLEVGCGHGGFVRVLRDAGFDARGLELSPWLIGEARRRFDVEVYQGPLESLELPERSFVGIAAFDVLEHLRDPEQTVRRCRSLLADDGVLFLQTPCYRGEGPGWGMLRAEEHVFLFNDRALSELLERAGFRDVEIESSLYPYDCWAVAAPALLPPKRDPDSVALPAAMRALLDLRHAALDMRRRLERSEADAAARLAAHERAEARLAESDADRAARLAVIERIGAQLAESEADRAARLAEIERLGARLAASEAGAASLRGDLAELEARVRAAERRDGDAREKLAALERDRRYRWLRFLKLLP